MLSNKEDNNDKINENKDDFFEFENFKISEELLSKEKEYLKLNKKIQSKTDKIVKEAEDAMKEGKETFQKSVLSFRETKVPTYSSSSMKKTEKKNHEKDKNVKNESETKKKENLNSESQKSAKELIGLPGNVTENDIGLDATNRLLKAKLDVLQKEFDKLLAERNDKSALTSSLEEKLRILDDEKAKISKTLISLQTQIEKHKKDDEEYKKRKESYEVEISNLKKEITKLKRGQKQSETDINSKDIKLNRTLDELERYKTQVNTLTQEIKELKENDRKSIERLIMDNKQLEKQKSEILLAMKKQMQLIDVLKKQKMHIEAAKLLQFTEEEFIKALNWNQ
ncbi:hypothetical protein BCR32DRAFT_282459 [Anaeromyces robustus]|uniref:Testis-expressed sequence 9 protein n=1 Tax=Anaeromyces robustus TaxID=1754192 RepID=A0A1Y1WXH5_9FUNG|nr:hypothetical protein BCR32DRAFT_282459 [Anaeromyces robustus]|eukprot:ORX78251.1 hypothetical protein BCR32DRAFT_282459 [Anaeromyces robustus]